MPCHVAIARKVALSGCYEVSLDLSPDANSQSRLRPTFRVAPYLKRPIGAVGLRILWFTVFLQFARIGAIRFRNYATCSSISDAALFTLDDQEEIYTYDSILEFLRHGHLATFDTGGNHQWSWFAQSDYGDAVIENVAFTPAGSMVITGAYQVDFQIESLDINVIPEGLELEGLTSDDWTHNQFFMGFSPTGEIEFAYWTAVLDAFDVRDLAVDGAGNTYLAGTFTETEEWFSFLEIPDDLPNPFAAASNDAEAGQDAFIARFDNEGNCNSVRLFQSPEDESAFRLLADPVAGCYLELSTRAEQVTVSDGYVDVATLTNPAFIPDDPISLLVHLNADMEVDAQLWAHAGLSLVHHGDHLGVVVAGGASVTFYGAGGIAGSHAFPSGDYLGYASIGTDFTGMSPVYDLFEDEGIAITDVSPGPGGFGVACSGIFSDDTAINFPGYLFGEAFETFRGFWFTADGTGAITHFEMPNTDTEAMVLGNTILTDGDAVVVSQHFSMCNSIALGGVPAAEAIELPDGPQLAHVVTRYSGLPLSDEGLPVFSEMEAIAFPNPTSGHTELGWTSQRAGLANLVVHNFVGQRIHEQVAVVSEGTNRVSLDVSAFPPGAYCVSIQLEGTCHSARFIKQ